MLMTPVSMQAGLKLSPSQESEILAARKRLLTHLTRIECERTRIVSAIGLELLQVPKVRVSLSTGKSCQLQCFNTGSSGCSAEHLCESGSRSALRVMKIESSNKAFGLGSAAGLQLL